MDRHDANHSSRIPIIPLPTFQKMPSSISTCALVLLPRTGEARETSQADLQRKDCVHGEGGKWWEGERRTKTTTKQKRKEKREKKSAGGGKNSEAGLFLSSLPSIQCQQGRSTTVASHGAQKNLTSVFQLMESRVDRRLVTARTRGVRALRFNWLFLPIASSEQEPHSLHGLLKGTSNGRNFSV